MSMLNMKFKFLSMNDMLIEARKNVLRNKI